MNSNLLKDFLSPLTSPPSNTNTCICLDLSTFQVLDEEDLNEEQQHDTLDHPITAERDDKLPHTGGLGHPPQSDEVSSNVGKFL